MIKNNFLITGASGFIGGELINRFSDSNVTLLSRSKVTKYKQLNLSLESFLNDAHIKEKYDVAIHLAGLAHNCFNLEELRKINVDSTVAFARKLATNGLKRFVFISTIGVNGSRTLKNCPFSHYSIVSPHSDYAITKYEAEVELTKLAKEMDFELVVVRAPLVYGLNAPGNFASLLRLVRTFPILPFGLVNNRRDFVSVQNLTDLIYTCSIHPDAGGHIFLASDNECVSIKEFTNAIAKGLNTKLIQLPVPLFFIRALGNLIGVSSKVEQLVGDLQVDSSNAQEVLGWVAPFTMEQAMALLSENKK